MPEQILIASDHAGFELKQRLGDELRAAGLEVTDLGPTDAVAADYADFAHPLARAVAEGTARRGVLLCGTGLGMSYAANRWPGVRAAVAWRPEVAVLARQHNDANVLVLPARFLSVGEGAAILRAWLETPFEGGRHARRVAKIERAQSDVATATLEHEDDVPQGEDGR
jgi:ribose 5-phosphate isomerase B